MMHYDPMDTPSDATPRVKSEVHTAAHATANRNMNSMSHGRKILAQRLEANTPPKEVIEVKEQNEDS